MCNQLKEVCPACHRDTGVIYRFPTHGDGEECKIIDKGEVFVTRERLVKFECANEACTLSKTAIKANQAKFSAAARKDTASVEIKAEQPGPVDLTTVEGGAASTGYASDTAQIGSQSPPRTPAGRSPTSNTPATQSSARKHNFFRAKTNVEKATLPIAIQQEIDRLMAVIEMKPRAPLPVAATASTSRIQAPAIWLDEEDNLVQLLRINKFPYSQMAQEYIVHRTRGAIEHRRMKQRRGQIGPPFVYIPDNEEEESPIRETKRARRT